MIGVVIAWVSRRFLARMVALAGPLVLLFGVAALAGTVGLPTGWQEPVLMTGIVVVLVAVSALCHGWGHPVLMPATLVAAVVAAIVLLLAVPDAVLAARGRTVVAVVRSAAEITTPSKAGERHEWRYQLALPDGQPLAGRLVEQRRNWQVGEDIRVVVDPTGRVDPHDPADVAEANATLAVGVGLIVLTFALAVATARRSMRPSTGRRSTGRSALFPGD